MKSGPTLLLAVVLVVSALLSPAHAQEGEVPPVLEQTLEEAAPNAEGMITTDRRLTYMDALILGVVEGVTEYLPISSTGHLILTNRLLGLDQEAAIITTDADIIRDVDGNPYTLKQAADAYAIVIQGGAILAVLIVYWRRILFILQGILGLNAGGLRLGINIIVAFLPAAVFGLLFDEMIARFLFGPWPVVTALIGGAILMLIVEKRRQRKLERMQAYQARSPAEGLYRSEMTITEMGVHQALLIGLLQCVAMWPGTSRSMMTIVGGYIAGLKPTEAAEFSFLLGLVTLTAASGYKVVKDGQEMAQALDVGPVLFGCFVATIAAALSVRWLVSYLGKHGLSLFAWYRIALAVGVAALLLI